MTFASTKEVAQAAQIHPETLKKLRRISDGPFQENRDWFFIGLGTKRIRWDLEQALASLRYFKRPPSASVETFSRSLEPVAG